MKLVREHISFKETSDPVKDMGIGYDNKTIEGFLKINGYEIKRIKTDFPNGPYMFEIEFSKDNMDFIFEINPNYNLSGMRDFNGWYWVLTFSKKHSNKAQRIRSNRTQNIRGEERLLYLLKQALKKYKLVK